MQRYMINRITLLLFLNCVLNAQELNKFPDRLQVKLEVMQRFQDRGQKVTPEPLCEDCK